MTAADILRFAAHAARAYPLRTALMMAAMAIGVAAVVVLTALGDGARRYIVGEFASLGTHLVIVLPGRTQTGGLGAGNFITNSTRDLTLADAAALARAPLARRVAPFLLGGAEISANGRLREVSVLGATAEFTAIRRQSVAHGRFLPAGDWQRAGFGAVIGETIRAELFGNETGIGRMIRLGDRRLRVIGVMSPAGQGLEMNTDELVIIPVATAQSLFNTANLFRILVEARDRDAIAPIKRQIEHILRTRHGGELDVTLVTQDAVLDAFDRLLGALTLAVAGIAAISLAVAGILVMNVMLVAVTQRTAEIGLLKALGANNADVVRVFLTEAALLSIFGALIGCALGHLGAWLVRLGWPGLPVWPPGWAVAAALGVALCGGLAFGAMPARRAAALDPVSALTRH
ncbi:MAG: ABC transporter permease [Azoarcus sp.]|jgi:putative ABC transport system permease protein|nr:ABC transporter permease [Azoarcus sp.]